MSARPRGAALLLAHIVAAALGAFSIAAQAARPFFTDDARIVDNCQIETFYKEERTYSGSEFWFLPACNTTVAGLPWSFEITAGSNRIEGDRNGILQAKFLLKKLEPNDIGYALSLGSFGGDPYFNFVTSRSFVNDRYVVHANLGSFRETGGTWGLGLEALLYAPRIYGIVETFGQHRETPTWHYGIRFWAIPDRFQIDATRGDQTGTSNRRFYTLGLRILF
jgi:hypothetical protein